MKRFLLLFILLINLPAYADVKLYYDDDNGNKVPFILKQGQAVTVINGDDLKIVNIKNSNNNNNDPFGLELFFDHQEAMEKQKTKQQFNKVFWNKY